MKMNRAQQQLRLEKVASRGVDRLVCNRVSHQTDAMKIVASWRQEISESVIEAIREQYHIRRKEGKRG